MYELLPLAQQQQQTARREAEQDRLSASLQTPPRNTSPSWTVMDWLHSQGQRLRQAMGTP